MMKNKSTLVWLIVSLSTKKFLEIYIKFSCVAWSGRGETPVGLARQLRPCRL